jgi:hypothetical protein
VWYIATVIVNGATWQRVYDCMFVRGITVLHDGNVQRIHGVARCAAQARGVRGGHFSRYSMETESCAMAGAGATRTLALATHRASTARSILQHLVNGSYRRAMSDLTLAVLAHRPVRAHRPCRRPFRAHRPWYSPCRRWACQASSAGRHQNLKNLCGRGAASCCRAGRTYAFGRSASHRPPPCQWPRSRACGPTPRDR